MVLVECHLEHVTGIGEQAGEDLPVRPRDSGRGVAQAIALGVLADGEQQFSHGTLGAADVHARENEHLCTAHSGSLGSRANPRPGAQ
jgi:hypothetical protein